jgi:formylmethanofuran dehydrogenase subunit D
MHAAEKAEHSLGYNFARRCRRFLILFFIVIASGTIRPALSQLSEPQETPRQTMSVNVESHKDLWDIVTCLGNVVSALFAGASALFAGVSSYFSYKTIKQANAAEADRQETTRTERMASVWREAKRLRYLSEDETRQLDSEKVADVVLDNVNTMGKIGYWWHTKLIDRDTTERELGPGYKDLYRQIQNLGELKVLQRTGQDLLKENPFATDLYLAIARRFPDPAEGAAKPS